MAGRMNRPRRMTEPSKTWNIMFPIRLIGAIKKSADSEKLTAAALVRKAAEIYMDESVPNYAEKPTALSDKLLDAIRSDFPAPKYANGKTLGDVIVDKIIKKEEELNR